MQARSERLPAVGLARRHPHVGALVVFAAVICGLYAPVLGGSRSLITDGPWSQPLFVMDPLAGGPATAPLTRLAAAAWLHLHLPVIDPFQGFGIPLLVNQGVPVYPPQLLFHLLFPSDYSIWNVVNLLALAFGVYLLARSFGQAFLGALCAGLLAGLAGAAPPNINMSMLNPLAVLPFLLLAVRYALDPDSDLRLVAALGTATAIALLCLSGFQEVLPLMAIVVLVYGVALVVHFRTWQRPLLVLGTAASAVAGAAIGSVGILPTLAVVGSATTLNGPGDYLPHLPAYWLATLTFPTITGRALNQAPLDLGNAVYTLGTPLLVLVLVLALAIALRPGGRRTRWYVVPSAAFVVYGVLAYADIGRVLQVLDIPLLDEIQSRRFLQFAWWVPLCLLLGLVVSEARLLRWKDGVAALLAAGAFDVYFFARFRQALAAGHVPTSAVVTHAAAVAGVVVVLFAAAAMAARRFGPALAGVAMSLVVLASCVYDLPTNFPPASYGSAVTAVVVGGGVRAKEPGGQLAFFGTRQLPTQQHSVQVYGPIIPKAYAEVLTAAFSPPEAGGLAPTSGALPTLAELTLTPRAVSVLRSLGVSLLVVPTALPPAQFPSVPSCSLLGPRTPHALVCLLARRTNPHPGPGYTPGQDYDYRVLGAHPLVDRAAVPVPVASTADALADLTGRLSGSVTSLPPEVYVTSDIAHLHAAHGVEGVWRRATAESVSITLRSQSPGLVVLRESYQAGLRATVNGREVAASPVDGGLWTAVPVEGGRSAVVLDYATTADRFEFSLEAAGLLVLAVAWLVLAGVTVERRLGRTTGRRRSHGPRHRAGGHQVDARRADSKTAATAPGPS